MLMRLGLLTHVVWLSSAPRTPLRVRRTPRALPDSHGRIMRAICRLCGEQIAFIRTMASETGRGGRLMPLNPEPDPAGNVAVRYPDRLYGRVLRKDEHHDEHAERLYMPHVATCAGSARNIAKAAEQWLAEQTGSNDG